MPLVSCHAGAVEGGKVAERPNDLGHDLGYVGQLAGITWAAFGRSLANGPSLFDFSPLSMR